MSLLYYLNNSPTNHAPQWGLDDTLITMVVRDTDITPGVGMMEILFQSSAPCWKWDVQEQQRPGGGT